MSLKYYEHSLLELPWQVAEAALQETDLAIIPLGSVEAYGHLPLGTDGIAAEAIAAEVARRLKAIRTPLLPVGYTITLAGFPGTLSIDPEALENTLRGMGKSLVKAGIKRIFVVNGHAGNNEAVNQVLRRLTRHGVKGATIQVWFFARSHDAGLFENYNPHGHASEAGTSMMLYLRPDLVDSTVARRHKPEPNPYPDITMPLDGRIALPEGMHGDTSAASAEKGRELFERMANRICQFIENWP